jgi:hypothetical protein
VADELRKRGEAESSKVDTSNIKLTRSDKNAISTLSKAVSTQTDMPITSIKDGFETYYAMLNKTSKDHSKIINDQIAEMKKLPEFDRNAALARFGFQMAAAAAKPGTPGGLAGIIQAAGTAAPSITEALDEHNRNVRDAKKIGAQLTIEQAKYEAALERGDKQTALGLAQNMRMMEAQMAQLTEQKRHNVATEGIQRSSIGQKNVIMQIADRIKADPSFKGTDMDAMQKASVIAGYGYRTEAASQGKLAEAVNKIEADYKNLHLFKGTPMYEQGVAERDRRLAQTKSMYGGGEGSTAPATSQPTIDFNKIGKT